MRASSAAACLLSAGLASLLLPAGAVYAAPQPECVAPSAETAGGGPRAPQRILTLNDGTSLCAEVVEDDDTEDYVLIKNQAGVMTRIPRSQLRRIQPVPSAGTALPPAAATPPRTVIPDAGALQLTLTSNNPSILIRRVTAVHRSFSFWNFGITTTTESEPYCLSRCQRQVSAEERNSRFLITGDGVAGAEFRLPPQVPAAAVNIQAGSTAARVGGFILLGAGGAMIITGLSLLISNSQSDELRFGLGIPLSLAGAAALGGGIAIAVKYRTKVQVVAAPFVPR